MAIYESDITQFIKKLREERPGLEERQRQGRALLWDKEIDRDFARAAQAARVPQKAYVYGTSSDSSDKK
ncbi:MAG TPA: DUF3460 family protein [Burkholderiaceae bacterium]|nr:DUF3460 family protein [Burkholderiaceae bacterium]